MPRPSPKAGLAIARDAAEITKSDTVDFAKGPCDAIYVGGAGIVQAVMWNDVVVPFTAVAGGYLNICCKRVNSTNTTATLLVALYV